VYKKFPLLLLLVLAGCVSAPPKFSSDLIRQWNANLDHEFPGREPGLAHYKKDPYELFYLAASHENVIDSGTIKLVTQLFEKNKFNVLLIESIPNSSGESPRWFLIEAEKGLRKDFIIGGESAWAVIQANKRKIPFFAGEPDHQDIYLGLKALGYTDLDVIGFYVARQTPQWVREREKTQRLLERKAPPFIKYYCKIFSISACPTLSEAKRWYREKNGLELNVGITNDDVGPEHDGKLFTQRISSAVGDIRDKFTLKIIESLVHKYQRVAVIYGAGHFVTLRKSFDVALGEPVLSKVGPK
jgi:hypothetical protein